MKMLLKESPDCICNIQEFYKNKNKTKDRIDYINDMNVALQKLVNKEDKKIIQEYMLREKVNRFRVIRELNISEGSYYRIRNKAFYNFAYVLEQLQKKNKQYVIIVRLYLDMAIGRSCNQFRKIQNILFYYF